MHNNLISKKINRLFESKNLLKLKFFLHKLFKEKDIGSLQFDFKDKPSRIDIVQMIINSKNYKKYLEIGCFKNELFDNIVCNFKVGVEFTISVFFYCSAFIIAGSRISTSFFMASC